MTLTIFKNDEFKNVGFCLTEQIFNGEFLRKEIADVYHYGIQAGWRKEVSMTRDNISTIQQIMLLNEKKANLDRFQWTVFDVLKENDWYNGQGVKMTTIDDEIKKIDGEIESALNRLK